MSKGVFLFLHNGLKMVLKCSERKRSWKIVAVEAKIIFSGTEYILCFVTKAWMEALGFTISRLFWGSFPGTSGCWNSAMKPLGTTAGIKSLPSPVWGHKFTREHHPQTPEQLLPLQPWPWFSELCLRDLSLVFRVSFYCCCSCAPVWVQVMLNDFLNTRCCSMDRFFT